MAKMLGWALVVLDVVLLVAVFVQSGFGGLFAVLVAVVLGLFLEQLAFQGFLRFLRRVPGDYADRFREWRDGLEWGVLRISSVEGDEKSARIAPPEQKAVTASQHSPGYLQLRAERDARLRSRSDEISDEQAEDALGKPKQFGASPGRV